MDNNIFDNSVNTAPLEESFGQATETAAEETQVETAPSNEEQGAQEGTAEESWTKEFQSPEDLYKAYQNTKKSYEHLRPKFTKTAQELSDLRRSSETPQVYQNNAQVDPSTGQPNDARKILADFVGEVVRPIKEQNEELMMHNQVTKMLVDHPDFAELAEDVMEVFKDDPSLWNTRNPLEKAYKIAKVSRLSTEVSKAVADTRNAAYADKEIKVLGAATKNQPKTTTASKSAEDQIGDAIVAAYRGGNNIFL